MTYTQKQRMCQVISALGDDALLLQRMRARESLSEPFCFELELLSEHAELDFEAVVGRPLAVCVRQEEGGARWFHGIAARFEQGPAQGRFAAYRAQLVPWFALLRWRSGCRIFQHRAVPEIARQLFAELGLGDFRFELGGRYPPREYCVQYRETDLDFVSRLLEDSGIGYFFEHREHGHTLVLFDSPAANPPCPAAPRARELRGVCMERELRSGACALADFDFEQPRLSLLAAARGSGGSPELEIYDYPGGFRLPAQGDAQVRLRLEREECAAERLRGSGHCAAFTAGQRFELCGHARADWNGAYLIAEVVHELTDTAGHLENGATQYANRFACAPHARVFRPPRRAPRPIVHGAQTATVVGCAGSEIDVDALGRVVVQFHWDREGRRDQNSSCRVRVAQGWAGKGFGWIAHPRVGQEVIVEFLEGDPDRPIVVGCVYNGEQTAPYALPAQATQTGIRSRSSPGGGAGDFNEIRFEDRKGEELLVIQAERDRCTRIKNDESQSVGRDRSRCVGRDESVTVGGDRTLRVERVLRAGAGQQLELASGSAQLVLKRDGAIDLLGSEISLRTAAGAIHIDRAGIITIAGTRVIIEP